MENGVISLYNRFAARQAYEKITELISTIQLSQTKAVTLDRSKQLV
jgi:hypothetical protein